MTIELLIIDDNETFSDALSQQLEAEENYICHVINNPLQAIDFLKDNKIDLIILDQEMPEMHGTDLCHDIRELQLDMPIIFLTANDDDGTQIDSLNVGANDYVTKPVRLQPLLARIRAQLRQYDQIKNPSLKIGPYDLHVNDKILLHEDGTTIKLVDKEVSIIRFLINKTNNKATKKELLEHVWGYSSNVVTHTLESHIYRLRKKLKENCDDDLLVTNREGYELIQNTS